MDEWEGKNEHVSVTTAGRVEHLGRIKLWQYASQFCGREGLHGDAKHAPDAPCMGYNMHHSWVARCALHGAKNAPLWAYLGIKQGRLPIHHAGKTIQASNMTELAILVRMDSPPAGQSSPYQVRWAITRRSVRHTRCDTLLLFDTFCLTDLCVTLWTLCLEDA